jgi:hypothetical protein
LDISTPHVRGPVCAQKPPALPAEAVTPAVPLRLAELVLETADG